MYLSAATENAIRNFAKAHHATISINAEIRLIQQPTIVDFTLTDVTVGGSVIVRENYDNTEINVVTIYMDSPGELLELIRHDVNQLIQEVREPFFNFADDRERVWKLTEVRNDPKLNDAYRCVERLSELRGQIAMLAAADSRKAWLVAARMRSGAGHTVSGYNQIGKYSVQYQEYMQLLNYWYDNHLPYLASVEKEIAGG